MLFYCLNLAAAHSLSLLGAVRATRWRQSEGVFIGTIIRISSRRQQRDVTHLRKGCLGFQSSHSVLEEVICVLVTLTLLRSIFSLPFPSCFCFVSGYAVGQSKEPDQTQKISNFVQNECQQAKINKRELKNQILSAFFRIFPQKDSALPHHKFVRKRKKPSQAEQGLLLFLFFCEFCASDVSVC